MVRVRGTTSVMWEDERRLDHWVEGTEYYTDIIVSFLFLEHSLQEIYPSLVSNLRCVSDK